MSGAPSRCPCLGSDAPPAVVGHPRLWLRGLPLARWRLAPLPDPCALAAQGTQVVELCPAYAAPGHHLDLVQRRAVHREGALHPNSVTDLADRERLSRPAALAPDDNALEDLDPGPAALDHADVHPERVSRPEVRDIGAELGLLQVGDRGVHG